MRKTGKDYISEWITTSISIDMKLINELREYADDLSISQKIIRVHHKCLRQGHIALAEKIRVKYKNIFPKSDLAMAMGYALIATKQQNDEKDSRTS